MFDAAGRLIENEFYAENGEQWPTRTSVYYDGDGHVARQRNAMWMNTPPSEYPKWEYYFIRSSVLGGATVTEIDKEARKRQTIVYAFGRPLAYQRMRYSFNPTTTTETVSSFLPFRTR